MKKLRYNIPDLEVGMVIEHKEFMSVVTGQFF